MHMDNVFWFFHMLLQCDWCTEWQKRWDCFCANGSSYNNWKCKITDEYYFAHILVLHLRVETYMCFRHGHIIGVRLKNTALWDIMLYSLMDVYQHFGETYCLHLHGRSGVRVPFYLKDGGNTSLQNISKLLPNYIVSHSTRQYSLYQYHVSKNPQTHTSYKFTISYL
jgi:hypothetical protein